MENVHVDLKTSTATYEETKPVSASLIAETIKKAGYDVVE